MVSATEVIVIAFAVTNSLRVVAYLPQIVRLIRDQSGAAAVSTCTWMLFLVSHVATAAYAGVVLEELWMCLVFVANALCSTAIVILTCMRRRQSTPACNQTVETATRPIEVMSATCSRRS